MDPLITIRPELLTITGVQLESLAPYLALLGAIVFGIFFAVVKLFSPKWPVFFVSLAGVLVAGYLAFCLTQRDSVSLFNGMMISDSFSNIFNLVFLLSALVTVLISASYLDKENLQMPEFNILVLFSTLGMMLMVSSLDLIVLFIGLEVMSLSVYTLVGFRRADRRSTEAAVKYFVLGGVASAVLLYGVALLYGATGSMNLLQILEWVRSGQPVGPLFSLGAVLVVAGFLFKVASVPFHMWMPDVYEGAPSPITGLMTTGVKAASFAAMVRVVSSLGFGQGVSDALYAHMHDIIWVSAVVTMVVGNLIALNQTNIKRMLAYSSIAHTGYLLVGMVGGGSSDHGYSQIFMYLLGYSVMNLGAFSIVSMLSTPGDRGVSLQDLSGLSKTRPWLAFAMAVFMFSMAGIPPTVGFVGKYLLFSSAVQAGETPLVVIAVLCSAISLYYYLRVLVVMYMREPTEAPPVKVGMPIWSILALASMVWVTFQLGLMPQPVIEAARRAVSAL